MAKKPDSFYFDNYVACADLAVQAAELLTKIFENFDPAQIHDMLDKMHAIEHAADKKHHELEDALLTAFITPLEREDLDLMSCSLDTVLDRIEGVVQRVYFTNIQSIHPDAIVIAHKVTDACRAMKDLMVELPNYRKSKTLRELVSEGLAGKMGAMPPDIRKKMRRTITRIVNEGRGGVICILL